MSNTKNLADESLDSLEARLKEIKETIQDRAEARGYVMEAVAKATIDRNERCARLETMKKLEEQQRLTIVKDEEATQKAIGLLEKKIQEVELDIASVSKEREAIQSELNRLETEHQKTVSQSQNDILVLEDEIQRVKSAKAEIKRVLEGFSDEHDVWAERAERLRDRRRAFDKSKSLALIETLGGKSALKFVRSHVETTNQVGSVWCPVSRQRKDEDTENDEENDDDEAQDEEDSDSGLAVAPKGKRQKKIILSSEDVKKLHLVAPSRDAKTKAFKILSDIVETNKRRDKSEQLAGVETDEEVAALSEASFANDVEMMNTKSGAKRPQQTEIGIKRMTPKGSKTARDNKGEDEVEISDNSQTTRVGPIRARKVENAPPSQDLSKFRLTIKGHKVDLLDPEWFYSWRAVRRSMNSNYSLVTCSACDDKTDFEEIVICDLCDEGFHLSCVGLTEVPVHTFMCNGCRVLVIQARQVRRKHAKSSTLGSS